MLYYMLCSINPKLKATKSKSYTRLLPYFKNASILNLTW